MCGIFGYVGESNAADLTLEGLKTLEYRGYDSWGVAVIDEHGFRVEKKVGKIGKATLSLPHSKVGIGHTRWATHGGVTAENSHPHLACNDSLALVHNGIVENYHKLKKDLVSSHKFVSETDTEVIVHMVEDAVKRVPLRDAVAEVFQKLEGLNAIAVAAPDGQIVVAKNGSPLVLGVGKGEYFLASDATALLKHTRQVIFLEDQQLAILGKTGIKVFDLTTGKEVEPQIQFLDWEIADHNLGAYQHFMIKEIFEQPRIIRSIAAGLPSQAEELAKLIKKARGTFFIGTGTAFNACLTGAYLFSKLAKRHVNTVVGSEFNYLEDFLTPESLVIAFSQSGETIDVIEPLNRAKKKGATVIAVVNSLGSTIYRMADYKVLLGAGPELAVASTKAFIAKLSLILLITYAFEDKIEEGQKLLLNAADEIDRLLLPSNLSKITNLVDILYKIEHIYVIGRGVSYPLALEAALKIKEVSYIHTEGLAGGELKHGPIALIDKGTPVLVFAPNDETYASIISNATEIRSRGGLIIGIGPMNSPVFDHWVEVRDIVAGSVLPNAIPAQLLGYFLALKKGLDPDKPRNLAKAVTVK